jgi:hypothetical protein
MTGPFEPDDWRIEWAEMDLRTPVADEGATRAAQDAYERQLARQGGEI